MNTTNKRMIKILDSIPKFETYSKYNTSLEKVFHDNSLKQLIKNLKEEKKPQIYSFFNVEEKKLPTKSIFQPNGIDINIDEPRDSLLYDTGKAKIKTNDNTIKKSPIYFTKNNSRPLLDAISYNPNYNSIYKNIPCVKIRKPSKDNSPLYKFNNEKFKSASRKKIENPFLTEIGKMTMSSSNILRGKRINLSQSKIFQNINISESPTKISKIIKTEENEDKNNHSLKFENYLERKEIKYDVNPKVSYIQPYNYQKTRNKSIDFKKMQSRENHSYLISDNIKVPSIGYYNINYNCLDKNMGKILLGDLSKRKKNKKYLLKKLWANYGVTVNYKLVNNKKLGKLVLNNKIINI